ncbi:iron uptake transporter permease EfeU [Nocardia blacklockiae]|uniref:iron uptake transporter permease EfeU n=1 Tax=Nocardia blacklockiae TaxID=480036 RepID=UPI001895BCE5|nr:iron uptake transporter permease EfeU [Nocardia blacklockiae]MBF6175065.1 FTR1 family protein [Nocardia blacklockiae]
MELVASAPTVATQLFGSGLLGVREGLETGIVVMVLAAFLVKSDRRDGLKWLWAGVAAAVVMVLTIFAVIHYGTSTVDGLAAEAIAGVASLVAVVVVTLMVLWMRSAAAHISQDLKRGMARALQGGGFAILFLAFLAVGREGVETALLMVGYAENTSGSSWPLVGLVGGVAIAAVLAVLMYYGAIRIDLAMFFRYTGAFLVVVAAGILGYGVRALQLVGWLPGGDRTAFDISAHFDQSSWYGTVLAGIFNFRPDPTVLQAIAWVGYLVIVLALFLRPVRPVRDTTADATERVQTPAR